MIYRLEKTTEITVRKNKKKYHSDEFEEYRCSKIKTSLNCYYSNNTPKSDITAFLSVIVNSKKKICFMLKKNTFLMK